MIKGLRFMLVATEIYSRFMVYMTFYAERNHLIRMTLLYQQTCPMVK